MSSEETQGEKKTDIKSLVNIIPPASALRGRGKEAPKEKRVKVRRRAEVKEGTLLISIKLAKSLGVSEDVEISVKGKKLRLRALQQESLPEIEVWANPQDMTKLGIEDNSTVTLRSAS